MFNSVGPKPRNTEESARKKVARFLTTKEAAELLCTSEGEIRNKVWRGQLPAYKPFRKLMFREDDLMHLVEVSEQRRLR